MKKTFSMIMICLLLIPALCTAEDPVISVFPCSEQQECTEFICLDEEADCFCLQVNGDIRGIVLEEIVMEEETAYTRVFWTEEMLPAGSSIVLKAYQGEVFPRFRFTCLNSSGETERYFVAESGKDGSLFLIAESQDPDFLIYRGLEDTENESEYLIGFMSREIHTRQEKNSAALSFYELWESLRISVWGGYAQSYAEQDWQQHAEETAMQAAVPYETEECRDQVYYTVLGEQTRAHVLELWGIRDVPSAEETK